MITIYGSGQCPKTVKLLEECARRGLRTDYRNISEDLKELWGFILIRDSEEVFCAARKNRRLGIPCVVCENGTIFDGGEEPFDLEAVMEKIKQNSAN